MKRNITIRLLLCLIIFHILSVGCTTFPLRAKKKQVRITFVGDIMCHSSQLLSYYNSKTKSYQTEKSFDLISSKFTSSDLVFGNLETTLVSNPNDYSGYPRFGSPENLAIALKNSGFHILSTANNHSADKGSAGIDNTISTLTSTGLIPIGTYKSLDDYQSRRNFMIERNQIRIAVYNYTYSTNGIKVPNGKIVRLIDERTIKEDIAFAKSMSADFIIIWFHWGTEYQTRPDSSQIKWANFALSTGADVVIGGHPHVVQKIEKRNEQLIVYSLGNFVSAQNRNFTDGGMMIHLNLILGGDGKKQIRDIEPEPVWVQPSTYRILPVNDLINEKTIYPLNSNQKRMMLEYHKEFNRVMMENEI